MMMLCLKSLSSSLRHIFLSFSVNGDCMDMSLILTVVAETYEVSN